MKEKERKRKREGERERVRLYSRKGIRLALITSDSSLTLPFAFLRFSNVSLRSLTLIRFVNVKLYIKRKLDPTKSLFHLNLHCNT